MFSDLVNAGPTVYKYTNNYTITLPYVQDSAPKTFN